MCWGGMEDTKKSTTTQTLPSWITSASQGNVARAENLANTPYTPYEGPRVADFSADQNSAFDMVRNLAGADSPYMSGATDVYSNFASGGADISLPRLIDNIPGGAGATGGAGSMQDYMNPYIESVLGPMLEEITRQSGQNRLLNNRDATRAGAFGDTGHALLEARRETDTNKLRTDTTGKAYSDAFGTAMNLRNSDLGRLLDVMKTNLSTQKAGADSLMASDKYEAGKTLDLATALGKTGEMQQAQEQKKLDVPYQDFLASNQWNFDTIKLLNSVLSGTPYEKGQETVVQEPNNSGWQMIGSLGSALLSDRRMKENVAQVGELYDGTPVYRFNYIGDRATQIGLMAQDVEAINPDAVHEHEGVKYVDYDTATRPSLGA